MSHATMNSTIVIHDRGKLFPLSMLPQCLELVLKTAALLVHSGAMLAKYSDSHLS